MALFLQRCKSLQANAAVLMRALVGSEVSSPNQDLVRVSSSSHVLMNLTESDVIDRGVLARWTLRHHHLQINVTI